MRRPIDPSVLVTTWTPKKTQETRNLPPARPTYQDFIADWFNHPDRGQYTTAELAIYCSAKKQTVSQWRRGRRPSPIYHGHIAEFFSRRGNVSIETIFRDLRDLWSRRVDV